MHCVIVYITEPPVVLPDNPLEVLSEEYREIVEKLVLYQDKYELPSEDDVARLAVSCLFLSLGQLVDSHAQNQHHRPNVRGMRDFSRCNDYNLVAMEN